MEDISIDRIQCSYRILIGPLDDKVPKPFLLPNAEVLSTNTSTSSKKTVSSISINNTPRSNSNNDNKNSTSTSSSNSEDLNNNNNNSNIETTSISSSKSTNTIKSNQIEYSKTLDNNNNNKSAYTIPEIVVSDDTDLNIDNNHREDNNDNIQSNPKLKNKQKNKSLTLKKKDHNNNNNIPQERPRKTLLWRSSGFVFVPQLPDLVKVRSTNNSFDKVVKHDVLLCMKLVGHLNGKTPKAYKAVREARNLKQKQDWCQLEVVLTKNNLSCYDVSQLLWPRRKLKCNISLQPLQQNKSELSLFLLSPLDYTFCLQYASKQGKECTTMVFRARSITLCQEWYVAIYKLLSNNSRKPFPRECDIFIPTTNIRIQIPLNNNYQQAQSECQQDSRYHITNDQIKEAILDLLDNDPIWKKTQNQMDHQHHHPSDENKNVMLCWTHNDRTEWIYWKNSIAEDFQIDKFICPQSIEKSHQLELRHVQHTPHNVTLSENVVLREPPPVEGYLNLLTDFEGRNIKTSNTWIQRKYYFFTFGSYLFYTYPHKFDEPDVNTYMEPNQVKIHSLNYLNNHHHHNQHNESYDNGSFATVLTPFPYDKIELNEDWQHEELRRRMKLMKNACGIINLTDILYVQRMFLEDTPPSPQKGTVYDNQESNFTESGNVSLLTTSTAPMIKSYNTFSTDLSESNDPSSSHTISHLFDRQNTNPRCNRQSCIAIFMKNGVVLKLQAYSNETCEYWVTCLNNLIVYARARREAYKDVHNSNKSDSPFVKPLNIEHKDYVDTRVWSFCLFDKCHDLARAGTLYIRSGKKPFSQKQFILTSDGWFHYYNVYKRSETNGKPINTSVHGKKGSIDLANAYIYAGAATYLESTKNKKKLDRPPRLFQNGVASSDTDEECIFTIWIPKKKRMFSTNRQRIIVHGYDKKINSKGVRWVFLAPSRKERDEWVFAINVIHEQLLREANKY